MTRAIIFGGTGNLGRRVAGELTRRGYHLTCVLRDNFKAHELHPAATLVVNATDAAD